jgi:hypothetical protein
MVHQVSILQNWTAKWKAKWSNKKSMQMTEKIEGLGAKKEGCKWKKKIEVDKKV